MKGSLSPTQLRILNRLQQQPGRIVPYGELRGVWASSRAERIKSLRHHTVRLNRFLQEKNLGMQVIAVRGAGLVVVLLPRPLE